MADSWQRRPEPDAPLPVRGMYFATHFGNWYVNAPEAEVCAYIRRLAARGINHLMLWLDLSGLYGPEAAESKALIGRLRRFASAAREAGMAVGLARVANEAWRNSPPALRADPKGGRGAIMLSDLCVSKPEARQLIATTADEVFGFFEHLDFICLWPYDSGGCGCAACQPWGNGGFLTSGAIVAQRFGARFPAGKIILSTWLMDAAEWQGVRAAVEAGRLDWVDAIMAELFHGEAPKDLLAGDVPRDLPLLGFPEISMEGMEPWGGCGGNPKPSSIEARWRKVGGHVAGGFPYSEGVFEDLNKAIYAGLYQNPTRPVEAIVRDYLAEELSPEQQVVDNGVEMLRLLEATLPRKGLRVKNLAGAAQAFALAAGIATRLRPEMAAGWPWRVLHLRAKIDALLEQNAGAVTADLRGALTEIHALYHADETSLLGWLLPPLPPRRESPDPTNIAAHCPVRASSSRSAAEAPAALVDNVVAAFDPDHFWSSSPADPEPWVVIDLGHPQPLSAAGLQFRAARGRNEWYFYRGVPSAVTVEVSNDGERFDPVVLGSRDVPLEDQLYKQWFYRYPIARTTRHVRLRFGASRAANSPDAGCIQLCEIRLW